MKTKTPPVLFLYVALIVNWASFMYAQQVAPPPVLWLQFNGSFTDSSSISTASPPHDVYGVLNATFTNDVPNATLGTNSLFLPGDGSYVEVDNVSDLNFNTGNPFSVSSWIQTTNGGLIWALSTTAADEEGDENTLACFIGATNAVDTANNGDGEPVGSVVVDVFNVGDVVSVATNLNDGNWHHVVVTYTANNTWSLYIDGEFDQSASFDACNEGANDEGPWSFTVGATLNSYFPTETGTGDPYGPGEIDQVGVWNLTLSADQVASVYTNGIPSQSIEITQQPMSTNLVSGGVASFSVAGTPVNISGTLSYQWESNGVAIVGATSATYTTPSLTSSATYSCLLTVSSVTVSTESAIVSVLQLAPPPGSMSVFEDGFANSTINSATPSPPNAASTSYEEISSKTWNPNPPTIGPGNLEFGIGTTTSGGDEVQALFTTNPVTLQNPGNYIQLVVTFADTNMLASDTDLGMGLFDSGQVAPWGGGLDGDIKGSSDVNAATGGAQNWQGYIAQIAYLGGTMKSDFASRPVQDNGDNDDQVTEVIGSSSVGFENDTVFNSSTTPNVVLTPGNIYTEVLTYTLLADGSLEMQADLYATNTSGLLLSSELANSGAPALTTTFDAFSVGWRSKDNSNHTAIDLQSVQVTATVNPASIPLQLESVGANLIFTWSNPAFSLAFSTNVAGPYAVIPGATSPFTTNTSGGDGFFRLVWP